jgi:hypothetical protein
MAIRFNLALHGVPLMSDLQLDKKAFSVAMKLALLQHTRGDVHHMSSEELETFAQHLTEETEEFLAFYTADWDAYQSHGDEVL